MVNSQIEVFWSWGDSNGVRHFAATEAGLPYAPEGSFHVDAAWYADYRDSTERVAIMTEALYEKSETDPKEQERRETRFRLEKEGFKVRAIEADDRGRETRFAAFNPDGRQIRHSMRRSVEECWGWCIFMRLMESDSNKQS